MKNKKWKIVVSAASIAAVIAGAALVAYGLLWSGAFGSVGLQLGTMSIVVGAWWAALIRRRESPRRPGRRAHGFRKASR